MNSFKFLMVLILACISSWLMAQKPLITGKVFDKDSYDPVINANISIVGTKTGCASGPGGEFSVVVDSLPVYMIISHLGYETRRIWLENASGGLDILLDPTPEMLREVEIKAIKQPVPFFKDEHYAVLDYEVDNTLVYLLIYRYRIAKSQLICKTDDGDTLAMSGNLNFIPTTIFSDCLGYLHVLSADSSYQVYLREDTILFPYHTAINRFMSRMKDCVASTDDWLYFRKESQDHQEIDFFMIHRKSKKRQFFASVTDDFNRNMLRHNPYDRYLLTMDTLPNGAQQMAEWMWVRKILYTPNETTLKKIGDTLAVFNTTDGSFELYNLDGFFITDKTMSGIKKGTEKWTEDIFFDEMTGIPYTTFIKNGRLNVYRIDMKTGELKYILTTGHVFPQKTRIHNNYLFYLYDIPGTGDNKHLFRQKI